MFINVDPMNQSKNSLDAREAAALLGVKLPTLYAYVSRGLLRSQPGGAGRQRRYARSDVERLRDRRGLRAGEALRWGEPILDTAITEMTPAGPVYRGQPAVELARAGVPFESVAELLWTGALPARRPAWPPPKPPFPLERLARLLPEDAPPLARQILTVSALAPHDPGRFDCEREAVLPRARLLVRWLAAALAAGGGRAGLAAALAAPSVAASLAAGFGLRGTTAELRALDALLVLLADHELNASTFAARVAASARADPYAAVLAGLATLSGPLHGGAADRMEALLAEVHGPEDAARAVHERQRRGEPVPSFGHPYYVDGDPRAALLFELAAALGSRSPTLRALLALVDAMREAGRPGPNSDAGAVALRAALGLPRGAAAGLFAVGRCAGWIAHALEQYETGELLRPRARYRPD
jgi:citrate synthase